MLVRVLAILALAAGTCKDKACNQGPQLLQRRSLVEKLESSENSESYESSDTEEEFFECEISVVEMDLDNSERQEVFCHTQNEVLELELGGEKSKKNPELTTGEKAKIKGFRGERKVRVSSMEVKGKGKSGRSLLQSNVGVRSAMVLMVRWLDEGGELDPIVNGRRIRAPDNGGDGEQHCFRRS